MKQNCIHIVVLAQHWNGLFPALVRAYQCDIMRRIVQAGWDVRESFTNDKWEVFAYKKETV